MNDTNYKLSVDLIIFGSFWSRSNNNIERIILGA